LFRFPALPARPARASASASRPIRRSHAARCFARIASRRLWQPPGDLGPVDRRRREVDREEVDDRHRRHRKRWPLASVRPTFATAASATPARLSRAGAHGRCRRARPDRAYLARRGVWHPAGCGSPAGEFLPHRVGIASPSTTKRDRARFRTLGLPPPREPLLRGSWPGGQLWGFRITPRKFP
jgi:hypothetical protein